MKVKNYELDDKVDKFIEWYRKNKVLGHYTEIGVFQEPKQLRNFIEKMAVWYELRYPEYEVNRLMPGSNQEMKEINNIMFYENNTINELFNQLNNKIDINWCDFYNFDRFINSLPYDEASFLDEISYIDLIYITINNVNAHLHVNSDGTIDEAERIGLATRYKIRDEELEGKHLNYLLELLKKLNITLPKDNGIEHAIKSYKEKKVFKEELLNCVMYRIIERGGNRIGPRRGLLFAKEFNTNIDIPMIYGIDYSDPGLYEFIAEYIKAGGSKQLVCIDRYFAREKKNQTLDTITIIDIITNALRYYSTGYPNDKETYELLKSLVAENDLIISTPEEIGIKDNNVKQLKIKMKKPL